ncbi:hypothetical protein [Archangium lipolyticum]|uniref:hypothetical protein n=1 Tax=Archangium lipolyticum TaxID=2970465 RepID=UPI00214A1EDD|nr:hypothetical protein [Archangium lipolyticum]
MRERAFQRAPRVPLHAWLAVVLLVASACTQWHIQPDGPPPPPPENTVALVGDGSRVAGSLGPSGGSLSLSQGGPRLEVPAGAIGPQGLLLSMRVDEGPGHPAEPNVAPVGPLLLISPMLEPSNGKGPILSIPLSSLPVGSDPEDLTLAAERPGDVGPGEAGGSPVLTWEYLPAQWVGERAVAELPRLRGMRLQFVVRDDPSP